MTENHPFFKKLADRFCTDDPKLLDDTAVGHFAMMPPYDRNDIIDRTDEAIGDNNFSLRRRAQLLDFSRRLKLANYALRRAGR